MISIMLMTFPWGKKVLYTGEFESVQGTHQVEPLLLGRPTPRFRKASKRQKSPLLLRSKQPSSFFPCSPFVARVQTPSTQLDSKPQISSIQLRYTQKSGQRPGGAPWRWCRRWQSTSWCSSATRRWARRPSSPASCTTSSTTPTRCVLLELFTFPNPVHVVCLILPFARREPGLGLDLIGPDPARAGGPLVRSGSVDWRLDLSIRHAECGGRLAVLGRGNPMVTASDSVHLFFKKCL